MEKARFIFRRKICRFCTEKAATMDYKDIQGLRAFLTDRGKIIPRRISGNCSTHQRQIARSIKRSRSIALLPFIEER